MASFSQFRTSFSKKPEAKQVTWLCGTERVLVEEVTQTLRRAIEPQPWNYVSMLVGDDPERAIWAEVGQYPSGDGKRLVVIRNAEKLKHPERIAEFLKTRTSNPDTYLILISNEERLARVEPTEDEIRFRKTPELVPHLKALTGKGWAIECRPYTQDTAKHAITWVQSKVPMRAGVAGHLLERANGDLRLVRDMCRKLAVFPSEPTITTINDMLAERPRDTFSDALLALDKKTAHMALERMSTNEYSRMIGFLDSRLDLAGMVHDMLMEHKTQTEISRAAGNKNFLIPDLMRVAKHYDVKRRLAIRKTLAMADEVLRRGTTLGVMEAVVADW